MAQYERAGSDGAFVPGLTDTGEIARLAARVALPLNVWAGHAGVPPVAQLTAAGARRISVGCGPLQSLLGQDEEIVREILERSESPGRAIWTVAFCLLNLRTASASPTLRYMGDASRTPRLPTLCPVCKGKVIQRMPNPTHRTVIWFYCAFCKHTWKVRIDDPEQA